MIGLDTNVLARYYVQDEGDVEALKQREAARRLMEPCFAMGCPTSWAVRASKS